MKKEKKKNNRRALAPVDGLPHIVDRSFLHWAVGRDGRPSNIQWHGRHGLVGDRYKWRDDSGILVPSFIFIVSSA